MRMRILLVLVFAMVVAMAAVAQTSTPQSQSGSWSTSGQTSQSSMSSNSGQSGVASQGWDDFSKNTVSLQGCLISSGSDFYLSHNGQAVKVTGIDLNNHANHLVTLQGKVVDKFQGFSGGTSGQATSTQDNKDINQAQYGSTAGAQGTPESQKQAAAQAAGNTTERSTDRYANPTGPNSTAHAVPNGMSGKDARVVSNDQILGTFHAVTITDTGSTCTH